MFMGHDEQEQIIDARCAPALNDCTCACHRVPGVHHVVACCHPAPMLPDVPVVAQRGLTFAALRAANVLRCPEFRDKHGRISHPGGIDDWTPADWLEALIGELGEYANVAKKHKRGDLTLEEALPLIAKELADAQCYLDMVAARWGIDLGAATLGKWNEIAQRVGTTLRISACGQEVYRVPGEPT